MKLFLKGADFTFKLIGKTARTLYDPEAQEYVYFKYHLFVNKKERKALLIEQMRNRHESPFKDPRSVIDGIVNEKAFERLVDALNDGEAMLVKVSQGDSASADYEAITGTYPVDIYDAVLYFDQMDHPEVKNCKYTFTRA